MVRLEILVKIEPENRFEFTQTFEFIMKLNHRPRNCIGQMLFEKVEESNTFLWVEDWKTAESLEAHKEGQRFRSMLGAVNVLGSLIKQWNLTLKEGEST
jgi:quinol monooxygenase YgiN